MNLKLVIAFVMWLVTTSLTAQRVITPTDFFVVEGKIVKSLTISLADLEAFPKIKIKDQIIYNQKGEVKDTLRNIQGVLLKTILEPVEFVYEKPKELNEFYFVFTASDGYRVVFSWNEIYNTEAGNQFYVVTEHDGKSLQEMEERILFISAADLQTGRRHIKALQKIEVKRLD